MIPPPLIGRSGQLHLTAFQVGLPAADADAALSADAAERGAARLPAVGTKDTNEQTRDSTDAFEGDVRLC